MENEMSENDQKMSAFAATAREGGVTLCAMNFPILRGNAALLIAAFQLWPLSPLRARAVSEPEPEAPEPAAGTEIRPGDDFFAFANRDWLKAAAIPAGKQRWGARDEINALTRRQIAALLEEARTAPAGSTARKVADFRAAWLNEEVI